MNRENILNELRRPFDPSVVEFKPQATTKDGTKALAVAYADLRAYQSRLDEVLGLDWSVTYTAWGERIVCHLTIAGVTRSSTGESDSREEKSEIAGTSAEAQAFKRACAMFGLGRYLYELPSVWVEYDANSKQFTDKAKAKLEGVVVAHYRRTMQDAPKEPTNQPTKAPIPDNVLVGVDQAKPAVSEAQVKTFDALGLELYGSKWGEVARHNCLRISEQATEDAEQLTVEQLDKLIDGMQKVKRFRENGTTVGK